VDKLFISADSLLRDSMELARLVVSSGFRPTFLVAMWRGGAPIGIAVQEVLEYHSIIADHIAIRTSSYTGIDQADKTVRVHAIDYLVSRLSAEDELLLVDDVFDSGRSLEAVIRELKQRCRRNWPEKWRIATVYYKSSRNRSTLLPDYYVLDTDKWLVFPHELIGLTPEEILEHKPVRTGLLRQAVSHALAGAKSRALTGRFVLILLALAASAPALARSAWSSSIRTPPDRAGRTSCR
jgi:hypoxanthine phosphoribosyltransferase